MKNIKNDEHKNINILNDNLNLNINYLDEVILSPRDLNINFIFLRHVVLFFGN